jgi:hypothetical protein
MVRGRNAVPGRAWDLAIVPSRGSGNTKGRVENPSEGVPKLLLGGHSAAVFAFSSSLCCFELEGRACVCGGGVVHCPPWSWLCSSRPRCVRQDAADGCVLIIQLGRWCGKGPHRPMGNKRK